MVVSQAVRQGRLLLQLWVVVVAMLVTEHPLLVVHVSEQVRDVPPLAVVHTWEQEDAVCVLQPELDDELD